MDQFHRNTIDLFRGLCCLKESAFGHCLRRSSEKLKSFNFLISILLLGIIWGCNQSEKKSTPENLLGKYEITGFNTLETIELRSDGEFIYERILSSCLSGSDIQKVYGSFLFDSAKLKLNPKHLTNTSYLEFDSEPYKKDSLEYSSSDSIRFKKEYYVFIWDTLTYLLSEEGDSYLGLQQDENDFEEFSNYYNAGAEPKQSGSYFVKRINDHHPKTELNIADLPAKYQNRFLKKPIQGEILDVDKIEVIGYSGQTQLAKRYKLNRGRIDGVAEKMEFYGKDGCCIIRITEVDEKISFGRIYLCFDDQADCGKGDSVTTYFER